MTSVKAPDLTLRSRRPEGFKHTHTHTHTHPYNVPSASRLSCCVAGSGISLVSSSNSFWVYCFDLDDLDCLASSRSAMSSNDRTHVRDDDDDDAPCVPRLERTRTPRAEMQQRCEICMASISRRPALPACASDVYISHSVAVSYWRDRYDDDARERENSGFFFSITSLLYVLL